MKARNLRRHARGYLIFALWSLLAACRAGSATDEPPRAEAPPAPASEASLRAREPAPAAAPASELEAQVMRVYEAAGPGVVNITSRSISYDFFLNPIPQEGSGSGFVYDGEAHVVTNFHVVEGAEELNVTLSDGTVASADIVGSDPSNDLAVLRLKGLRRRLTPIPVGDSEGLRVGRFVIAIGNPFGLGGTMTLGVVSSLGRVIRGQDDRYIGEIIQTDAPINPGNSGGPLIDLEGRVVGVNTAIYSPSGASAGIGFAIPATTVKRVVPELIARGRYPHPWLGVEFYDLTAGLAQLLESRGVRVLREGGLLVMGVVRGGPADRAGVRGADRSIRLRNMRFPIGGDFIVAINGERVKDFQSLTVLLETRTRVGETITLTVFRDGRELDLKATLAERPR
jgi:S1-C subfamily serine protease